MKNIRVLILAAGKGTRMKSRRAKVLHEVGGAPLVAHVMSAAASISSEVITVIGYQADKVREKFPGGNFVAQTEQLGTGHAVIRARSRFRGYLGDVLVLPGDVPLVSAKTLKEFIAFHRRGKFVASVLTAEVDDPSGYGRIVRRKDGQLNAIVEHRDAAAEVLKLKEINSSIYVFDSKALFEALSKVRNKNAQAEYYLTDVIGILASAGRKVGACKAASANEVLGINSRKELAGIDRLMRRKKCDELMAAGVTIVDPDSTFIDAGVKIGTDTIIYPSVQIYGTTSIGGDCTIHSFCRISNTKIGSRATVLDGCIIVDCELADDTSVGPFAHLRMHTKLQRDVKVGNFVEIKKSTLAAGTKAMHLAYLGDATIGKKVNIGAGTITCNYDGVNKNPTVIEDGVFIGSDSQLIAPVTIGKGAYVAAGSSITDNVPPDSLAIARGRQTVKEGWAKARKKK